jgi:DNA-binding transcriptional regulator YhcF (GntR family)/predicted kinase
MTTARDGVTRPEAMHVQVARNIRNEIEAGVLHDGDVLPSTKELADQWGVSGFTISEAMKLLIAEGLVTTRARSKRTVHAPAGNRRRDIRTRKPNVVLVGGFAGSGKTELGRILARRTGWPILDKDTLTRPVVEGALEFIGLSPNDRESDAYVDTIRPLEYEALNATIRENVECGNSVIATAPFLREFADRAWLNRTRASLAALDAVLAVVWVYCDPDTMHRYLRHRGAARDSGKLSNWETYLKSIDIDTRPAGPHMLVDNSSSTTPLHDQADELLRSLLATE